MPIKVLFVCLGNICRSPTADGVFGKLVNDAGLVDHIHVDSAGTAGWHQGGKADARTIAAAHKRGFDLSALRARQVLLDDFAEFNYILAMDANNLQDLKKIVPAGFTGHLGLFLEFGSQTQYLHVPDPYHGSMEDFELVLDLVEDSAKGLLMHIREQYKL